MIRPFKAVRPAVNLVEKVAALPYDVMSSDEAREMTKDNPYSFLHVDKAEIDLDRNIDLYDERVYLKARENLYRMIDEGVFIKDEPACFYIYRQKMGERIQTGLVGCASIDDYINNTIKKHEFTRKDKEVDRTKHVEICNANTGPIFLTYRKQDIINQIINHWIAKHEAVYNFASDDGITHTVWVINDTSIIEELNKKFLEIDNLYIADGHHRTASAVNVGLKRREKKSNYTGEEEFNYFLAVIFPDEDLYIMDYNRLVKDLNGYSSAEFLEKISESFEVSIYNGNDVYIPEDRHYFGMYLDKKWYILKAKAELIDENDPVARLDVSILQDRLLDPILAIKDPRTENRIDFVGGIRGLKELERRVDEGMKVAFSMYPTTISELMDISDAGEVMPPKSTWFEPKLRSGVFVHELD